MAGRRGPAIDHLGGEPLFGRPQPPRPPRHEPLLLLLLAVAIAALLTLVAYGFLAFVERLEQAG